MNSNLFYFLLALVCVYGLIGVLKNDTLVNMLTGNEKFPDKITTGEKSRDYLTNDSGQGGKLA